MNWKNRSFVRFILILGSLLVMTALLTLVIKYRAVSSRVMDLHTIDKAIHLWDGVDEPKAILHDLAQLSTNAKDSGAALSLLKRYRILVVKAQPKTIQSELNDLYVQRADQFYKIFPQRAELLMLFLDSLSLLSRPLSESEKYLLKNISLRSISNKNAKLLMLVLQKAYMNTPAHFKELPYGTALLQELIKIDEHKMGVFAVNNVLALALAGNVQAALGAGNRLAGTSSMAKTILANLLYDFGSPEEGAHLFQSLYEAEGNRVFLLHTADAYAKAGRFTEAKRLWQDLLANLSGREKVAVLYNLGSLSDSISKRKAYFAQLLQIQQLHEYALVQYSRLLPREEAKAFVIQSPLYSKSPLLQLEMVRNDFAGSFSTYKTGNLWFLLNRFPQDERLYHWGAWYLYQIGNTQELEKLLAMATEQHIEHPALNFYSALLAMDKGQLAEAEKLLASSSSEVWYVPANLAKVYEVTYRLPKAIEYYQLAASFAPNPVTASRLYEQIGTCYLHLDKNSDARRSFEYALQLNPDSITASFALQKLERQTP